TPAAANTRLFRGTVVMDDGSALPASVRIERFCHDTGVGQGESQTNKKGEFLWQATIDPLTTRACVLRAAMAGYDSTVIEVSSLDWFSDPVLPPLVLSKRGKSASDTDANFFYQEGAPLAVRTLWNNANRSIQSKNWTVAERQLRTIVQTAPKFYDGWAALGS